MKEKILNYQFSVMNFKISGKQVISHPLFSGSAIMIFGSNVANFIAYVYHLIVGRMLGPAAYGELSSVISILGLVFAALSFLSLVIVKFVSAGSSKDLSAIYQWFYKKAFVFGVIMSLSMLILSPILANFLRIKLSIFIILSPIFFFTVVSFVYRSFLQGLLRFKEMVIATNVELGTRFVFGIAFIYIGWSVFGAVLGIVLSSVLSFILLRYYLRQFGKSDTKSQFDKGKSVLKYAIPILIASVATNSFFSNDVILVKHFFNPHDAGIYASLSTLGKIIFYGAGPVGAVMFPMIAQRHAKGANYSKIFFISFLLTLAISLSVVLIYWLIPDLSIKILYGNKYIEGAPYLVWYGLFMAVFTLSSLVLNLFLSRERTGVSYIALVFAILQAAGIWVFHETLMSVIKVSIVTASLMLAVLLLYFAYDSRTSKI